MFMSVASIFHSWREVRYFFTLYYIYGFTPFLVRGSYFMQRGTRVSKVKLQVVNVWLWGRGRSSLSVRGRVIDSEGLKVLS